MTSHRGRRTAVLLVAVVGLALAIARVGWTIDRNVPVSVPVAGAVEAKVVRVFDGDTIAVRIDGREERVRFLGVDTPERREGGPHEAMYAEAKRFTERRVGGGTVRLVADPLADDRDVYERLLRYVVTEDGTVVNEALIREGLGLALTRWPYERADAYVDAEGDAIRAGRGLWAPDVRKRIDWRDAAAHVGEVVEIEGTIVATKCMPTICFLNFDPDYRRYVAAVILEDDLHRFDGDPAATYRNRQVRVVGEVTTFRDRPQILLRSPAQIVVVP